jgi:hypothetical protein
VLVSVELGDPVVADVEKVVLAGPVVDEVDDVVSRLSCTQKAKPSKSWQDEPRIGFC